MKQKREPTSDEKAARIVHVGLELDDAIINFETKTKNRFTARADALKNQPFNSPFTDVLRAGQYYLSPLTGHDEHYWQAFISTATKKIKERTQENAISHDSKKINAELYNTLGMIMTHLNHPQTYR